MVSQLEKEMDGIITIMMQVPIYRGKNWSGI